VALPRLKTPIKGEILEGESISPPSIFMYYFAYGSNMSLDHMRRLCGWHCQLLGRATLPEFEIGLDKRGYANIKANPKELVYGVLFEIDEDGIKLLDGFEGYPDIFDRAEVEVFDSLFGGASQAGRLWPGSDYYCSFYSLIATPARSRCARFVLSMWTRRKSGLFPMI
jgi:gamma-glutamylcyclotransferase (GGCT)/AIG2-like uncharacterized protein YtfP